MNAASSSFPPSPPEARVSVDLEPLIENYMNNRRKDIAKAVQLLAEGNFEELSGIGHTMKGGGASYGFLPISEIGLRIEIAAKNSDKASIEVAFGELQEYIETVNIIFVED